MYVWPGGSINCTYPQLFVIYYPLSAHIGADMASKNQSLEQSLKKKNQKNQELVETITSVF